MERLTEAEWAALVAERAAQGLPPQVEDEITLQQAGRICARSDAA